MSSQPKHPPKGGRPAAERQFVGREEFVAPVRTALKESQAKPLVLVYYGGAGIGKSRLRRELTKQMVGDPGVLTATLDFDIPSYRQPETALLSLRKPSTKPTTSGSPASTWPMRSIGRRATSTRR